MAASANPTGNNQEGSSNQNVTPPPPTPPTNGFSVNSNNDGGDPSSATTAAVVSVDTQSSLRHNPGISLNWTPDEQSMLEDLLVKFASDSTIVRYAKIAMKLNDKTVREVALRCRWMCKKENGKRRIEGHSSARKNKDRREKGTDSSEKSTHLTTRPDGPSYALPMIPMDNDDGIPCEAIGGMTGELLEQNSQMFNQISANFAAFQVHDNINLLSKARDNILTIMNGLNDLPDVMKHMPPLPVKLNEELANRVLGRSSRQMKS